MPHTCGVAPGGYQFGIFAVISSVQTLHHFSLKGTTSRCERVISEHHDSWPVCTVSGTQGSQYLRTQGDQGSQEGSRHGGHPDATTLVLAVKPSGAWKMVLLKSLHSLSAACFQCPRR